ncbi:MAG TPA: hypothetical protein VIC85_05955 [Ktedonobacterales bacterium]|jgi:UDP:flavonoid glycosyltransferase YjiC (YdhE family)
MARIVLVTAGSAGNINPFIALGLGLRARDERRGPARRAAHATI